MEDYQLIKYCKKGKAKYQRMLLDKYSPLLMGVARRYATDQDEAKDILQDSWIKIFKALASDTYTDEGKLSSWLTKVVINSALKNKARNQARIVKIEKVVESTDGFYNSNVIENMTVQSILKIIDSLPVPSNQVFKLFVVDGFRHKEIAELLGIAESTSRVHLTNARVKIKSFFPNFKELINTK